MSMKFKTADMSIEELEIQIQAYTPDPAYAHDAFAKIAVVEAIQATKEGNIGVGGCVVKDGEMLIQDHNRQFVPYFRGDLHGEMVIMNQLEEQLQDDKHTIQFTRELN